MFYICNFRFFSSLLSIVLAEMYCSFLLFELFAYMSVYTSVSQSNMRHKQFVFYIPQSFGTATSFTWKLARDKSNVCTGMKCSLVYVNQHGSSACNTLRKLMLYPLLKYFRYKMVFYALFKSFCIF